MAFRIRVAVPGRPGRRLVSTALPYLVALVLLMGLGACGFDKQTNKPYTPAVGANGEIGGLKVRNLVIVSRETGKGFLSATLTSSAPDTLVGVSGNAIKADGSDGSPLSAALSAPVRLDSGALVVLTDRPFISITSADLKPGLEARVILQFGTAGEMALQVPVMDGSQGEYATVTPSASGSASS